MYLYFLAILITGVWDRGLNRPYQTKSVEMYVPSSNKTCSLPQLPVARYHHTQDGGLACGGYMNPNTRYTPQVITCDLWTAGRWIHMWSHNLTQKRSDHVSWSTAEGVFLIGGLYSPLTSELVKKDGRVEEGFALKYTTR